MATAVLDAVEAEMLRWGVAIPALASALSKCRHGVYRRKGACSLCYSVQIPTKEEAERAKHFVMPRRLAVRDAEDEFATTNPEIECPKCGGTFKYFEKRKFKCADCGALWNPGKAVLRRLTNE